MASLLSLVLATLVVGTVFNLIDEWADKSTPFRPISSLLANPLSWAVGYGLATLAGGVSLVPNVWFGPLVSVLIVSNAAAFVMLWVVCTEMRAISKSGLQLARFGAYDVGFLCLLAFCASTLTLWFLSLMRG